MGIIKIYYDEKMPEFIKKLEEEKKINKEKIKWIILPVKDVSLDICLQKEAINIFQEIILELIKSGCKRVEDMEEVVNFTFIQEGNYELIKYILKELEEMEYINDNGITEKGEEILKDTEIADEKETGRIFYNCFSGEYMKYIDFKYDENEIKSLEVEDKNNQRKDATSQDTNNQKMEINIGTLGAPCKIQIDEISELLKKSKKEFNEEENVDIDIMLKIIDAQISRCKGNKKKIEKLEDIRKYNIVGSQNAYILLALIEEKKEIYLRNGLYPERNDYSLLSDLLKCNEIKKRLCTDEKNFNKNRKKEISDKEELFSEIDNNIRNHFKNKQMISNIIVDFYQNEVDREENNHDKNFNERVKKYHNNIITIYNNFVEILKFFLVAKDSKKTDDEIYLKVKEFFQEYGDEEQERFFCRKNDIESFKVIEINKELRKIFIYLIGLEETNINNYIQENLWFISFVKRLIEERNRASHNGEVIEEDIEFDFEKEANERLICFIEEVFQLSIDEILDDKIKDKIKNKMVNSDEKERIEDNARQNISIRFHDVENSFIFDNLYEIEKNYLLYKELVSIRYKSLLMREISILFEKVMKEIKNKGNFISMGFEEKLREKEEISLADIEDNLIIQTNDNSKIIEEKFEKIKNDIKVKTEKIENIIKRFNKGTLNTYAFSLLLNKKNYVFKDILEKYPEFFKTVFVISHLRKHNGEFKLIDGNDIEKEKKAVEKLLDEVYENIYKILKELYQ